MPTKKPVKVVEKKAAPAKVMNHRSNFEKTIDNVMSSLQKKLTFVDKLIWSDFFKKVLSSKIAEDTNKWIRTNLHTTSKVIWWRFIAFGAIWFFITQSMILIVLDLAYIIWWLLLVLWLVKIKEWLSFQSIIWWIFIVFSAIWFFITQSMIFLAYIIWWLLLVLRLVKIKERLFIWWILIVFSAIWFLTTLFTIWAIWFFVTYIEWRFVILLLLKLIYVIFWLLLWFGLIKMKKRVPFFITLVVLVDLAYMIIALMLSSFSAISSPWVIIFYVIFTIYILKNKDLFNK